MIKFIKCMTDEEIVKVVCEDRLELKKLYFESQNISLFEYYKNTSFVEKNNSEFKSSIINIIKKLAKERGIVIDENNFEKEFSENFSVSTADHHGPLTHSFFYNSTILETLIYKKINRQYIIHLPCAGVSISNSSYPRGFLFYNQKKQIEKIPLFSISNGRKPVYALKINQEYINKSLNNLSENLKKIIISFFPNFSETKTYEEFITYINFKLWEKLTNGEQKLITIDQESVVREFLLQHIDTNKDIQNLFFKKENLEKYLEIFNGCVGAHNFEKHSGTHLFWYVGEHARERLYFENNYLKSESGIIIGLTKESIKENLKNKKIYPCMALTFIILNCFAGLRTDGGFCQLNYLKDIQDRFKKYIENLKMESHIYFPNPSIFRGEFLFNNENDFTNPINLILRNENNFGEKVEKKAKAISLQKSLSYMMDEFYKITTGKYPNKNNL